MKNFKTAIFAALCLMMLSGCGAEENYDNTAPTHTPDATHKTNMENNKNNNDKDTVRDDAGNIVDDAGDAMKDTGKAADRMMDDMGNAIKD